MGVDGAGRPGRKVLVGDSLVFKSQDEATSLEADVIEHGEFGERLLRFHPVPISSRASTRSATCLCLRTFTARTTAAIGSATRQSCAAARFGGRSYGWAALYSRSAGADSRARSDCLLRDAACWAGDLSADQGRACRRYPSSRGTLHASGVDGSGGECRARRGTPGGRRRHDHGAHAGALRGDGEAAARRRRIRERPASSFPRDIEFRVVGGLLTNFHLPQSSLLMLVSAFAGRENVLAAYRHAVEERYRFFSYGDCMLPRLMQ